MRVVTEPLKTNTNVNAEKWLQDGLNSMTGMVGSGNYVLPYDDDDRTALLYQFFLIVEYGEFDLSSFCLTMYGASNFQEMVHIFNQELVLKFTREVSYRLDGIMQDIGDQNQIPVEAMMVFHHHDHSMTIHGNVQGSNIAVAGSSVTNSTASVTSISNNDDLIQSIQELRGLLSQVEQSSQPEVTSAINVLEGAAIENNVSRGEIAKAVEVVAQVPSMRQHLESLALGVTGNFASTGLIEGIKFVLGI
jgi:hypothetical protein